MTKSRDEQLAKQQSLLLDAVDPYILEEAAKGELSQETMMEAAQTALKLLGDDPSMPAESKESCSQNMEPRLVDMVEDDELFTSAAPSLFGDGFCKKAKVMN